MSTRGSRIYRANQIFDQFPIAEYPPECQEKLKSDLIMVRLKLALAIEEVMSEETSEITSHVQQLLAELRINIDHLDDLVR
ncbi:MAG: hypothetical protein DCF22_00595 [Leptolyngbya sp.]|nr:MAG: hypothetical protein DCF22_00595 [Leptolyngbya sp.]